MRIVDFAHQQGAAIGVRLAHAGTQGQHGGRLGLREPGRSIAPQDGGWQTAGPSAVAFPGLDEPEELDERGIGTASWPPSPPPPAVRWKPT